MDELLQVKCCVLIRKVIGEPTAKGIDVLARLNAIKSKYLLTYLVHLEDSFELTLCHPRGELWLEVPLTVELRRVDEALACGVIGLQDNAVRRDEVIVVKHYQITNL